MPGSKSLSVVLWVSACERGNYRIDIEHMLLGYADANKDLFTAGAPHPQNPEGMQVSVPTCTQIQTWSGPHISADTDTWGLSVPVGRNQKARFQVTCHSTNQEGGISLANDAALHAAIWTESCCEVVHKEIPRVKQTQAGSRGHQGVRVWEVEGLF